jgi:hypothetical protein
MFTLIKWLLIVSFFIFIWFSISYFSNLDEHEVKQTKEDAIIAIENSDASLFLEPLSKKMKQNALDKFWEKFSNWFHK